MKLTGFRPYDKQKEIIDGVLNSDAMFHCITTGRQVGKSLTLLNLALYYSINKKNQKLLIVAPVYSQLSKLMSQMIDVLTPTNIMTSANRSEYEIRLINGSKIWFRSAERADSIRGLSIHYLFIDESGDIKTSDFQASILPTITSAGKKCMMFGTPKKRNFFYQYYVMGRSDNENYKTYSFPSESSPYVSKEFLREQKKSLPERIYNQEFMGIYQDSEGQVFQGFADVCVNDLWVHHDKRLKTFGGLDIGTKGDYSVLTIMDELGRVLYVWRKNHIEYSQIVDEVVTLAKKYNLKELLCETNGVGDPIYESVKKKFTKAVPFFQTQKTKEDGIRRLIMDIQDKSLELPSVNLFPYLHDELEIYEYEVLPSGKIRYTHPKGMNDDCVDSLMMANWSRVNPKRGGSIKISSVR